MRRRTGFGALLVAFLVVSGPEAQGSPLRFTVQPERSRVEFVSGTQLGEFRGGTKQVAGEMILDPRHAALVHLSVTVDLRSLTTNNVLRDRHMRNTLLDVARYPAAIFRASEFRLAPGARTDSGEGTLSGTLTLHGVERPEALPIHFRLDGKTLLGEGSLSVKLTDFHMIPPRLLGLKVRDQVRLGIHLVAAGG